MWGGRLKNLPAVAAALALLAITAGAALAATGDLTPVGCIRDNDTGPDACTQATDGLDLATAVTVSPEGSSLYAGSGDDDAIVHLSRDPVTGTLAPQGCVDDNDTGGDDCAQAIDGLNFVASVAVSPDGASVYTAAADDDAIVRFDRDPGTGALIPQGCLDDNDTGGEATCSDTNGLAAVRSVAVSPDGESIYAAARLDDAILRIDRDPSNGAFADNACIDDGDPGQGPDTCGPGNTADGLDGASGVAVSPDGKSVYVASLSDDAIAIFDRGAATGVLTPAGCIDDNDTGADDCAQSADGLDGAFSVAVSPDGLSVYATSLVDDAVVRFDRDPGSGALTPAGCVDDNDFGSDPNQGPDDCAQSADGLNGAASVATSSDGRSVYAVGSGDDALAVFDRSPNPGALTPTGCVDDNDAGPDDCAQSTDGLEVPASVALSPGSESVYTAAQVDDAVTAFAREGEAADTDPPETLITKAPKKKTKKRKAKFKFTSDEPGSTFQCKLDKKDFKPCAPPFKQKVKRKKHKFQVRAIDPAGNVDPTPAKKKWKVKKKKK